MMTLKGYRQSDEHRAKISTARKAYLKTPSHRAMIAAALKGREITPAHRAKLSAANLGKHQSEETKAKISASKIGTQAGKNNPMYGKHGKSNPRYGTQHSPESIAKMKSAKLGINNPRYGKHMSPETIIKVSGENSVHWKGGISFEPYCPKFNKDLKKRIRAFFKNQCVMCGEHNWNGHELSCHHVTYNKNMCCDGKQVRFAALCNRHHSMTNHGDRQRWEDMLHRSIEEIWDGKSYFTKEEYAEMVK